MRKKFLCYKENQKLVENFNAAGEILRQIVVVHKEETTERTDIQIQDIVERFAINSRKLHLIDTLFYLLSISISNKIHENRNYFNLKYNHFVK